jgi:hypothetical protein
MIDWEAIGAVGEILGAIAVVATIVYLSRQVRDNSKQVKINTTQSYASLVQDAFAAVYTNNATIKAWTVGTENPSELDEQEFKLYLHLMDRQINNVVPLINHFEQGAMSRDEFNHYKNFFDELVSSPGGRHWQEARGGFFRENLNRMTEA